MTPEDEVNLERSIMESRRQVEADRANGLHHIADQLEAAVVQLEGALAAARAAKAAREAARFDEIQLHAEGGEHLSVSRMREGHRAELLWRLESRRASVESLEAMGAAAPVIEGARADVARLEAELTDWDAAS